MRLPELSIILPCYNESQNIPLIVERMSKFWPEFNFELVLVNNGSVDDSSHVLKKVEKENEYIRVVTVENNRGYGYGILSGLKEARADVLSYSHADIQTPPEDLFKAFKLFNDKDKGNDAIFVKGERINRRKEEQLYTNAYSLIAYLVLGYKLEDINGQPKLFHKSFLTYLYDAPVDFSFDVYVLYKAMQNGLKIETFPVDFNLRVHGVSNWSSSPIKKYKTILGYVKNVFITSLRNLKDKKNPFHQFAKFCSVGLFGASVNYGTFYIFFKTLSGHYVTSSLIGYFSAAVVIFLLNRNWTFYSKDGHLSKQFVLFILLIAFSFFVNGVSIYFFTAIIGFIPELSQVITMGITTAINFVGSKFWVFK